MCKKIMIRVLGICLMLTLGSAADAAVCVKKIGSTCLLWSGSVICGIEASGLGNCIDKPTYLGCSATGTGAWMVACGNPGQNTWTSPGVNTAFFEGTVSGQILVEPNMCDSNGNAYVNVYGDASIVLAAAVAAGACPNNNWIAIDAVPCSVTVTDYEMDANGCVLADATLTCTLPNCNTLRWDTTTQRFEQRQYECVRNSYNRYKTPQCPAAP